jgi:hypothetical protein
MARDQEVAGVATPASSINDALQSATRVGSDIVECLSDLLTRYLVAISADRAWIKREESGSSR